MNIFIKIAPRPYDRLRHRNGYTDFLIDFPLPRFRRRFGRLGSTRTLFMIAIASRSKLIGR